LQFEPSADLRYAGQGFELSLPVSSNLVSKFHAEHQRRYGYSHMDRKIEIVTIRLRARMMSPMAAGKRDKLTKAGAPIKAEKRPVTFTSREVPSAILDRDSLKAGVCLRGPAIITEYSATTVIPAKASFQLDRAANLIIELRPENAKGASSAP
jgi:N-methylhydantoinase A